MAEVAVSAEKILPIDPSACVLNCRRAMEFAVKWMYSVEGSLVMPWDDKLVSPISTEEFRDIVDEKLLFRINAICESYRNVIDQQRVDPLLVIPVFIHDFLWTKSNKMIRNILTAQVNFTIQHHFDQYNSEMLLTYFRK